MKLHLAALGYAFAIAFGWMLTQYCTQPEEPPAPIRIVAPALHTSATPEE